MVGRLEAVRPGPSTTGPCVDAPRIGGCLVTSNLAMVVRVDRTLGSERLRDPTVTVPWALATGTRAPAAAPDIRAFQRCIPAGARVIVFLRSAGGRAEHQRWEPIEPSGIVFEAPDGVIVPHPDRAVAQRPESFATNVAEVAALVGR